MFYPPCQPVILSAGLQCVKLASRRLAVFRSVHAAVCLWLVVSRSSTQAVEEQKKLEGTLAVEVENARVRISEIQTELESVIEQLGEAKVGNSYYSFIRHFFSELL